MQPISIWAGLAAVALTGTIAAAEKPADLGPQVSIPFVNFGSINDWKADDRQGLWIQDVHKQWYYARTTAPCWGLDYALSIGFKTRGTGAFDRFSSILVPDQAPCQIASLTPSQGPPKKVSKSK
jgi:hypothetical protein